MIKLTGKQITLILILGAFCLTCYGEVEISIPKIIAIESSGDPHAFNKSSGAIGLMQITPICFKEFKNYNPHGFLADLYDPYDNVMVGTWYINTRIPQMLKAYGIEDTVENRLISYHDGIGNLRKYLKGERKLGKFMKDYLRKYEGCDE